MAQNQSPNRGVVGINHVALAVPDLDKAVEYYTKVMGFPEAFRVRNPQGRVQLVYVQVSKDTFIELQTISPERPAGIYHFGLVVDDKELVRKALADAGINPLPGRFLDFLDPWGNRVEVVGYDNIQFSKAPNVLHGMGLSHLSKNASAIKELAEKGMAPV
jgi:catechol 2,3-dioxygenase-like lactoylglutathione lyase family enzyme